MTQIQKLSQNQLAVSLDSLKGEAAAYVESRLLPDHWFKGKDGFLKPEEVVTRLSVAAMYGRDVGLKSMSEVTSCMYVVNNMPTLYGSGYNIVIHRSGQLHSIIKDEWNADIKGWELVVEKKMPTGNVSAIRIEYLIEDAEAAGLIKPSSPWAKYPKQMAQRKCWARLYAIHFPAGLQAFDYNDHDPDVASHTPAEWQDVTPDSSALVRGKPSFNHEMIAGKSRKELVEVATQYPEHADEIMQAIPVTDPEPVQEEQHKSVTTLKAVLTQAQGGYYKSGKIKIETGGAWLSKDEQEMVQETIENNDGSLAADILEHIQARTTKIKDINKLPDAGDLIKSIGFIIEDFATGEQINLAEHEKFFGETTAKSK